MATLSIAQVYALARGAGLDHEKAITATAVSRAENDTSDPARLGDLKLTTAKWGPSVGLWQIRSLNAEKGTGGTRDASRLTDASFNARSMYAESKGGRDWSPWTTYNDGAYRDHLGEVRKAVGDGNGVGTASVTSTSSDTSSAVTVSTGRSPFDVDVHLGPLSGPIEGLIQATGPLMVAGAFLLGGVALVGVGLWAASK